MRANSAYMKDLGFLSIMEFMHRKRVFHCHVQILGGQQLRHPVSHIDYVSETVKV